jgi:hypothetical protein
MYRLFSNPSNLEAVFASFGTIEAVKVKCNIDLVTRRLKIPSRALLEQMKQEGISLNDIAQTTSTETDWSLMSETVLRSHLRAAFLDEAKLFNALATLSLPQQVELRDMFAIAAAHLRLPSEMLLRRMQDEGLGLEKFGVKAVVVDKVDKVRDKLNALNSLTQRVEGQQQPNHNLATESHVVLPSSPTIANSADSIASLKQRINQLKNQSVADDEPSTSANVVALTHLQTRLKA